MLVTGKYLYIIYVIEMFFFAQQIECSFLKPLVVNQHYVPISQIVLCLPVMFSKDMR